MDTSIFIQVPDGGNCVGDVDNMVEFESIPVIVRRVGHEELFDRLYISVCSDEGCIVIVHGDIVTTGFGFCVVIIIHPDEFVHHA